MHHTIEQLPLRKSQDRLIEAAKNKQLKEGTISALKTHTNHFIRYIEDNDINLESCEYEEIKQVILDYKQHILNNSSEAVLRSRMNVVQRLMLLASMTEMKSLLRNQRLLEIDNIYYAKKPALKRQPVITKEEVDIMVGCFDTVSPYLDEDIKYFNSLTKFLILFLFYTGCRIHEALNINIEDIKMDPEISYLASIEIYGKGSKYRTVYMNKPVIAAMRENFRYRIDDICTSLFAYKTEHIDRENYYLPVHVKKANSILNNAYKIAGFNYNGAHVLRRGFATHLMHSGMQLDRIQQLLGHTSITTTTNYINYEDEQSRKAYIMATSEKDNTGAIKKRKKAVYKAPALYYKNQHIAAAHSDTGQEGDRPA